MAVRFSPWLSLLAGSTLAITGLPSAFSILTLVPLTLLFWHLTRSITPRQFAVQTWWAITAYFTVQLSWLIAFMHALMVEGGLPVAAAWPLATVVLFPLFALEGLFWALMAWGVARLFHTPQARLWGLAGGWGMVEWLRTLGPLAFPWGGLGYTFLSTPLIQVADLGGVLLLSVLMTGSAAALVTLIRDRQARPFLVLSSLWILGLAYGTTRVPGEGTQGRALLLRTEEDSFGKASGQTFPKQWQVKLNLSAKRRPGEILIWSETAVPTAGWLSAVPASGLYGVARQSANTAAGWDGHTVTGSYLKAHPVPFGEYFPLSGLLHSLYDRIFQRIGFPFQPQQPGQTYQPISLLGGQYGVYICYDSIFSQVARHLALDHAQVLVNVSNDGWYSGWGVWQHFDMGRVRAIETRRWMLRSVNKGIAAVVNDLGEPVQLRVSGVGVIHAEYQRLEGRTLYMRWGDALAMLVVLCLIVFAGSLQAQRFRDVNQGVR
ncbi:apolipoprotein N-acyltransferase [Deinococcus sp. UYEF24]